jgi:hypothetical protein
MAIPIVVKIIRLKMKTAIKTSKRLIPFSLREITAPILFFLFISNFIIFNHSLLPQAQRVLDTSAVDPAVAPLAVQVTVLVIIL